jgi:hypothetical protein
MSEVFWIGKKPIRVQLEELEFSMLEEGALDDYRCKQLHSEPLESLIALQGRWTTWSANVLLKPMVLRAF